MKKSLYPDPTTPDDTVPTSVAGKDNIVYKSNSGTASPYLSYKTDWSAIQSHTISNLATDVQGVQIDDDGVHLKLKLNETEQYNWSRTIRFTSADVSITSAKSTEPITLNMPISFSQEGQNDDTAPLASILSSDVDNTDSTAFITAFKNSMLDTEVQVDITLNYQNFMVESIGEPEKVSIAVTNWSSTDKDGNELYGYPVADGSTVNPTEFYTGDSYFRFDALYIKRKMEVSPNGMTEYMPYQ